MDKSQKPFLKCVDGKTHIINVVGAVLIKDNNIILARRSKNLTNFPNLFEFPGGKVEKGETFKEALKRELFEELNINVKINDIHEFYGNNSKHTIEKSGKIINLTLFIIKIWDGIIHPKENIHSEIAYVDVNKMDTFPEMLPGDAVFIKAIKLAINLTF
tara:strand:- start:1731 stop:2207 length:477 start_codon:yes stop_codon:yes gene_type:complete